MADMFQERKKDELLEFLWHLYEKHELTLGALREHDPTSQWEGFLTEFSRNGVVSVTGEKIEISSEGKTRALGVIRRHRLAERLLTDVLGKTAQETETAACEFEHVLAPELVDSICTLLGHPRSCPHGSPIPEGECCRTFRKTVDSAVVPLDTLAQGVETKIAMVNSIHDKRMQKLLDLGLVPGARIKIAQTSPVFVIELGHTNVALEKSIAADINVWRK